MKNNNGAQRNDKMGKITLAILMTLTMGNIAMAQRALPENGLSALSVKLSDSSKDSSGASSKLSEFFDHSLSRKNKEASPVYLDRQDLNTQAAGRQEKALNNSQSGAPVCPGCGGSGPVTALETRNKSAWEKIKLARPGAVPPPLTTVDSTPNEETKSKAKKNDLAGINKETSVAAGVVSGAATGAIVGAVASGGAGALPGAVIGGIAGGLGAAVSNVVEIIIDQLDD